jgi:DNA-binding response OmpR family regulator
MNLSLRLLHLPGDGADVTRERKSTPALRATARRRARQERPRESARILIVDDEPTVAESIRDHLLRRGYTVDLAFSADDALIAIRQVSRDLVLLDSAMPQIDGVEALRRIRALDASVAVIIVTDCAEKSLERETSKLGACDHVMKPIDFADLDRATRAALTRRGAKTGRRSDRAAELA